MEKLTKKKERRIKVSFFGITVGLVLTVYVLAMLFLFLWAFNSSLKTSESFDFDVLGITKDFAFDNYVKAFTNGFRIQVESGSSYRYVGIYEMFLNSFLYSIGGALCQTFCSCLVAYLIAKYDNPFSRFMHSVIIITMVLPIVGSLPSQINVMDALGIRGTLFGMYCMKFGFTNIYYMIFYGAFKQMSNGFKEAALIDGANHFQIFFRIIFPLVATLFGVVFLIFFIQYWNDYQTPMIFMSNRPVLAWGLYDFFQSYAQDISTPVVKIAGGVIVLIPLLILFMVFRNKLMGNLTEGGIK